MWDLSRGDGWITRRVKWGNSVVEFGGGELWEQGILKEGLGKEMGMMWENGNLEWLMVGVL